MKKWLLAAFICAISLAHAQTVWTNPGGATFTTEALCAAKAPAPTAVVQNYACTGVTPPQVVNIVVAALPPSGTPTATAKHMVTKAGFCLDATKPASVVQQTCNASTAQVFDDASKPGQYVQAGLCLNATPNADGTKMAMTACTSAAQWKVTGGTIKQTAGRCIDMDGSNSALAGTKAQIWTCDGSNEQQFTVGAAPIAPPVVVAPPPVVTPPTTGFTVASEFRVDQTFASQAGSHIQWGAEWVDVGSLSESAGYVPSPAQVSVYGSTARLSKGTYLGRKAIIHTLAVTDPLFSAPTSRRTDVTLGGNNSVAEGSGAWLVCREALNATVYNDKSNYAVDLDFHGSGNNGGVYMQESPGGHMALEVVRNPSVASPVGYDVIDVTSSFPPNTWLDVALYFKPSHIAGQGLVELYVTPTGSPMSNTPVVSSTAANLSAASDAPVYAKLALYYPTSSIPSGGAQKGYTDCFLVPDAAHALKPSQLQLRLVG